MFHAEVRGSSPTSANLAPRPSSCRGLAVGGVLAGGVPLWAVSPQVVFPPAVFGGCPPPVLLSRVAACFHVCVFSVPWRPGAWPTSRPTIVPETVVSVFLRTHVHTHTVHTPCAATHVLAAHMNHEHEHDGTQRFSFSLPLLLTLSIPQLAQQMPQTQSR